jgi:hypothetical protein
MDCCWSVNREKRPSFEEICALLRSEIMSLREDIETTELRPSTDSPNNADANASSTLPDTATLENSEALVPSTLTRSGTADTIRRSNTSAGNIAKKDNKKGFFSQIFKENDGGPRKKVHKSKFDAVDTSCHVKGRHKQANFRNWHNSNSLKERASRLLHMPRSFQQRQRRSSLEERSIYLMEKSDLSLEDLQMSSENINFSMPQLQQVHSQDSPRVFED